MYFTSSGFFQEAAWKVWVCAGNATFWWCTQTLSMSKLNPILVFVSQHASIIALFYLTLCSPVWANNWHGFFASRLGNAPWPHSFCLYACSVERGSFSEVARRMHWGCPWASGRMTLQTVYSKIWCWYVYIYICIFRMYATDISWYITCRDMIQICTDHLWISITWWIIIS